MDYIELDGSDGEGGGQVVRSALSLSMLTGRPFRMTNVRGGRSKPGLMRQHLACLRAAQEIASAKVVGDQLQSSHFSFKPACVKPGNYQFQVGSAGSTSLVLQTVFPALATQTKKSVIRVEGGTHNPLAPCTDFLAEVFAPLTAKIGFSLDVNLITHGFAPAGGGLVEAQIGSFDQERLSGLELIERAGKPNLAARILLSQLDRSIAVREIETLCKRLTIQRSDIETIEVESAGPGNSIILTAKYENCMELISIPGQVGTKAERVALNATNSLRRFIASDAPIGEHAADQLMMPAAIAAWKGQESRLRIQNWSSHCATHRAVIESFLPVRISVEDTENAVDLGFFPE